MRQSVTLNGYLMILRNYFLGVKWYCDYDFKAVLSFREADAVVCRLGLGSGWRTAAQSPEPVVLCLLTDTRACLVLVSLKCAPGVIKR